MAKLLIRSINLSLLFKINLYNQIIVLPISGIDPIVNIKYLSTHKNRNNFFLSF